LILGSEPVTLRRTAAGSRGADGRFVPGAATDTTLQASVQPMSGRDIERLPEGLRSRASLKLFAETELRLAEASGVYPCDRIVYDGEVYEVGAAQKWGATSPIPHYEAVLLRIGETGGET